MHNHRSVHTTSRFTKLLIFLNAWLILVVLVLNLFCTSQNKLYTRNYNCRKMFPLWGISKDFKSRIWNRNLKSLHILIKKARKCEWFSSWNGVSFIQPVSTLFKSCFAPVKAGHKFTMCSRHQLLKTLLPFSTLNDPTSLLKVSSRNIAFTDLRNCFIPLFFHIKLLAFGTIRNHTF